MSWNKTAIIATCTVQQWKKTGHFALIQPIHTGRCCQIQRGSLWFATFDVLIAKFLRTQDSRDVTLCGWFSAPDILKDYLILKMKALWCFEMMGTACQLTEHSTSEKWNLWGRWHISTSSHISSPNKLSAVWQIVSFLGSYFQTTFKTSKCEYTCTNLHRNRWFWQIMAVAMCHCGRGWF